MTFYNVISGILFLTACQSFLITLGSSSMWFTATLVVTILNEAVITSHLIERPTKPVPYKLEMKLLDFLTFGVLLWALLTITPNENGLNVKVGERLWGADDSRVFWGLLTVYWLITLWWNRLAGQTNAVWKDWFIKWMTFMWVVPLILGLLTCTTGKISALPSWTGIAALSVVTAYLLSKILGERERG